jgi:hypothetical protein
VAFLACSHKGKDREIISAVGTHMGQILLNLPSPICELDLCQAFKLPKTIVSGQGMAHNYCQ